MKKKPQRNQAATKPLSIVDLAAIRGGEDVLIGTTTTKYSNITLKRG